MGSVGCGGGGSSGTITGSCGDVSRGGCGGAGVSDYGGDIGEVEGDLGGGSGDEEGEEENACGAEGELHCGWCFWQGRRLCWQERSLSGLLLIAG